ncbi:MAG: tRNA (adenosine(37)-N6)-dimethylallyltransferase MiaA [Marinifilaceae bacterium]|nr:tRNA (adenosine(37)-N6)-dimethylallyltransferase MiaA [Marinifilaceae bacterium]
MRLVVLLGPTGVGKTDLCIDVAKALHSSVVSCDSRQIYKEMRIGTAVPSQEQLQAVPHFFIQSRSVFEPCDAWQFEHDAMAKIEELFATGSDDVVMCGGSMMYIDAVCKGIDEAPSIPGELRDELMQRFREEGLEPFRQELKLLDPVFYEQVDLNNTQRVIHAVEVCRVAGVPYSSLRKKSVKKRDFDIVKIGLNRDREELYDRINLRVDQMVDEGLVEEARALFEYRELNALNTVGYRELFDHFAGKIEFDEAIRLIKRNSRHYARKQLTWFKRDEEIHWFHPDEKDAIFNLLGV